MTFVVIFATLSLFFKMRFTSGQANHRKHMAENSHLLLLPAANKILLPTFLPLYLDGGIY